VKVKKLSDEIAVVHARMRLSGQIPVGGFTAPKTQQNIFSFVVHRGRRVGAVPRPTTPTSSRTWRRTS
jgi:hypothetical protein